MGRRLRVEHLEERDVPAAIAALDKSFSSDGIATLAGAPFAAVALQADGRIVAVGTSNNDFLVARFLPDGTLDTTFDGDGTRTIEFGGTDKAAGVAIDSSGRIIVVGSTTAGPNFAVARLTSSGALDSSFSGTGLLTINFGGTDAASAVAISPVSGKIIVVGGNGTDFAIARINPADGTLDATFGTGGKTTVDLGATDSATAVAIQANDRIVVAGTTGSNFAVARLLPADGSLDASFDTDGKLAFDLGGVDVPHSIAIQPNGAILVAGNNGADMAVVRLAGANGAFDPSFNTTGKVTVDLSGADDARTVLLQADGRILLVGDTGNTASDTAIVRLTSSGALDTTFNGTGKFTFDVTGSTKLDLGYAAVLTPQGRLVIAGAGGGGQVNGQLVRVPVELEDPRNLAIGGSLNAQASLFTPNTGTGQYNATAAASLAAFGASKANVRPAVGDVNGDGIEDTALVTGPGTAIRVAVVSGADNTTLLVAPFDPFGGNFTGGGFLTTADLDNDGRAEVIVTPDQGGGPRVTIFSLDTAGNFNVRANFFGIDDANFRGGARSSAGDVNNDGFADLAIAAGFQGGPRIALFDGATIYSTRGKLVGDFFAFDTSLRNGAYVTIGDVNGDGFADLYFGAGPGGSPRVLGISGQVVTTAGTTAALGNPLSSFFLAGNSSNRGGVRVATTDADGDSRADVIAGTGEGLASFARVYFGSTFTTNGEPANFQDLNPFSSAVLANGIFVG
ncbi:MAG: hypothetical protein U0791_06640 [Gemmataceae bacterium]